MGLEPAKSDIRVSDSTNCARLQVAIAHTQVCILYFIDRLCPLSKYNALNCLISILIQFLIVQT